MNVLILTPGIKKNSLLKGVSTSAFDAIFLTNSFYQKSFWGNLPQTIFEETDFLSNVQGESLDQTAKHFARHWFLEEPLASKMTFHGINLGSLYIRLAAHAFIGMLRAMTLFLNFFDTHRVTQVRLVDDGTYWGEVVTWVAAQRSIPVEKITFPSKKPAVNLMQTAKETLKAGLRPWARWHSRKAPTEGILYSCSLKYALPFFKQSHKKNYFLRETFSWEALWSGLQHHFFHLLPGYYASIAEEASQATDLLALDASFKHSSFFMFNGKNIWPIVRVYLKELLEKEYPQAKKFIRAFNALILHLKPSAIVVEEDVCVFNKALVLAGRASDVPTYVLTHGIPAMEVGSVPSSADSILVWGESSKKRLLDWGADPAQILEIGAPQYTELNEFRPDRERAKICRRFSLAPQKTIILLASSPFRTNERPDFFQTPLTASAISQMLKITLDFVSSHENTSLIIKLHPSDQMPWWTERHIAQYPSATVQRVHCLQRADSLPLVAGSDLLLTLGSTIYFEGLLLNKPVMTFDHSSPNRYFSFLSPEYLNLQDPEGCFQRLHHLLQRGGLEHLRRAGQESLQHHFHERNQQALNHLIILLEEKYAPSDVLSVAP